ncbi:hypothetical protein QR680_017648 [Steinernema hermaphroditum]|uniref:Uncharacterized protein n=1 Tax=Steinernema hermaphroditum TaxID=289476 RepID=A0AA39HHD1_9BILA|nr:hypothetical protein QR680_017648 [Steinernema hermaphroditum]
MVARSPSVSIVYYSKSTTAPRPRASGSTIDKLPVLGLDTRCLNLIAKRTIFYCSSLYGTSSPSETFSESVEKDALEGLPESVRILSRFSRDPTENRRLWVHSNTGNIPENARQHRSVFWVKNRRRDSERASDQFF